MKAVGGRSEFFCDCSFCLTTAEDGLRDILSVVLLLVIFISFVTCLINASLSPGNINPSG